MYLIVMLHVDNILQVPVMTVNFVACAATTPCCTVFRKMSHTSVRLIAYWIVFAAVYSVETKSDDTL